MEILNSNKLYEACANRGGDFLVNLLDPQHKYFISYSYSNYKQYEIESFTDDCSLGYFSKFINGIKLAPIGTNASRQVRTHYEIDEHHHFDSKESIDRDRKLVETFARRNLHNGDKLARISFYYLLQFQPHDMEEAAANILAESLLALLGDGDNKIDVLLSDNSYTTNDDAFTTRNSLSFYNHPRVKVLPESSTSLESNVLKIKEIMWSPYDDDCNDIIAKTLSKDNLSLPTPINIDRVNIDTINFQGNNVIVIAEGDIISTLVIIGHQERTLFISSRSVKVIKIVKSLAQYCNFVNCYYYQQHSRSNDSLVFGCVDAFLTQNIQFELDHIGAILRIAGCKSVSNGIDTPLEKVPLSAKQKSVLAFDLDFKKSNSTKSTSVLNS